MCHDTATLEVLLPAILEQKHMQMNVINTHTRTSLKHSASTVLHRSELNQPNGIHLFNVLIRSLDQKHLVNMKKLIRKMLEAKSWEFSDLCLNGPSLEVWDWVKDNYFHARKNEHRIRLISAKFCLNWLLSFWGWAGNYTIVIFE